MDWKVYYGNGDTFSSEDGKPEEAPPHGVVAVCQLNEKTNFDVINQWDWYLYRDGIGWWGYDVHGVLDQVMNDPERKIHGLIQGRSIPSEDFERILKTARNDPDFPPKGGSRKGETSGQKYGEGRSE